MPSVPAPVVIAIDPHKASWTAVAVDARLQPLATIRVGPAVTATGSCAASPAAGRVLSGRSKAPPASALHLLPVWQLMASRPLTCQRSCPPRPDAVHRPRSQDRRGRRAVGRHRRAYRHPA